MNCPPKVSEDYRSKFVALLSIGIMHVYAGMQVAAH
jgi:hypothetical protein